MIGRNDKCWKDMNSFVYAKGPSTLAGQEDFTCKVTNTEINKETYQVIAWGSGNQKNAYPVRKQDKNYLNYFQEKTKWVDNKSLNMKWNGN